MTPPATTLPPLADHKPRLSITSATLLAALLILLVMRLAFSQTLDSRLMQAAGALVFIALPLAVMRRTGTTPSLPRPSRAVLILAVLGGLLASIAGGWLLPVVDRLLTQWLGPLQTALLIGEVDLVTLLIVGLWVPLGQSMLFWVFAGHSLARRGWVRGAWLTALLFAASAMLLSGDRANSVGISAAIAALPLGIGAAFIVTFTGTAWAGIVVNITHGLAGLLLPPLLLDSLGPNALDLNWIAAALASLAGLFFLLQASRALFPQPGPDTQAERRQRQPLLWVYGALAVALALLELFLRSQTPA